MVAWKWGVFVGIGHFEIFQGLWYWWLHNQVFLRIWAPSYCERKKSVGINLIKFLDLGWLLALYLLLRTIHNFSQPLSILLCMPFNYFLPTLFKISLSATSVHTHLKLQSWCQISLGPTVHCAGASIHDMRDYLNITPAPCPLQLHFQQRSHRHSAVDVADSEWMHIFQGQMIRKEILYLYITIMLKICYLFS